MKHRRPNFRLKFRPEENRREEHEPKEGGFFLEGATFWEVAAAAIKGALYLLIGGAVVYALVWLVLLLPLLF